MRRWRPARVLGGSRANDGATDESATWRLVVAAPRNSRPLLPVPVHVGSRRWRGARVAHVAARRGVTSVPGMHTRQVILQGLGPLFLAIHFAMEEYFLGLLASNAQFYQPGFDAAIGNPQHPATISFVTRVQCIFAMLRIVHVRMSARVSTAVILFSTVVRTALAPVLNIRCVPSRFHRNVYLLKDANNVTVTVSEPHCSAGRPSPHRAKPHASRDIARAPERVGWRAGLMGGVRRIRDMIHTALSITRV